MIIAQIGSQGNHDLRRRVTTINTSETKMVSTSSPPRWTGFPTVEIIRSMNPGYTQPKGSKPTYCRMP